MRLNVTQGIRDYEGKFIEANKLASDGSAVLDSQNRPVKVIEQLRTYLINALNNQLQGENLLAEDKAQIYALSTKIYAGKTVDFTHHELGFMEERVGKIYGPLIYGRICDIFNGEPESRKSNAPAETQTEEQTSESLAREAPKTT